MTVTEEDGKDMVKATEGEPKTRANKLYENAVLELRRMEYRAQLRHSEEDTVAGRPPLPSRPTKEALGPVVLPPQPGSDR